MGSKRSTTCHNNNNNIIKTIILVTFFLHSSSFVESQKTNNSSDSLDAVFHDHASQTLSARRTGSLYKVSLPSNYSGMDVSVIRLRSGSFWTRGVNFTSSTSSSSSSSSSSYFLIPPRIITLPYVKRLAIVYQDLGNWSNIYYNVPTGYKLVGPVVGFFAYDASNLSALGNARLKLSIMGDPISVSFPRVFEGGSYGNATLNCVNFGDNGLVEMSNISVGNVCFAKDQGHFSVAIRVNIPKEKERFWKWWVVVCFGVGFVGLVLVGFLLYKFVRRKRIERMERQSEKGVAFDTTWIGRSKLPSASMIRTQPASIENEFVH